MKDLFLCIFLRVFILILSSVVAFNIPSVSAEQPSLVFHTDNAQDFKNYKSGKPGGINTATNFEVLSRLEYQYEYAYMTTSRSVQFMEKGENICVFSRIKTKERTDKFIFSDIVNMYLTKQLFQSAKLPPLPNDMLDELGAVYLPDVFKRFPERTVVYSSHITQGTDLDAQLDLIPARNKIIRNGSDHASGASRMFQKNRADYILLFPQALIEGFQLEKDVRSYPIAKATMYQVGGFMCTNNPFMRTVVSKIDDILAQLHQQNILFETHLKWLRKEDIPHFTRLYHQAIGLD